MERAVDPGREPARGDDLAVVHHALVVDHVDLGIERPHAIDVVGGGGRVESVEQARARQNERAIAHRARVLGMCARLPQHASTAKIRPRRAHK